MDLYAPTRYPMSERGRRGTYIIAVTFERRGELEVRHTYNLVE
jgi:hypothetical protein